MGIFSRFKNNNTQAALETRYDGITFRSRLEAKWAVLFNELGIHWQYEPYIIREAGVGYLPDFILTNVAFVPRSLFPYRDEGPVTFEVKHFNYHPTNKDKQKWRRARRRSHCFMVAFGIGFADGSGMFDRKAGQILSYAPNITPDGVLAFYRCDNWHTWVDYRDTRDDKRCPHCRELGYTDGYDQAYTAAITYFANNPETDF